MVHFKTEKFDMNYGRTFKCLALNMKTKKKQKLWKEWNKKGKEIGQGRERMHNRGKDPGKEGQIAKRTQEGKVRLKGGRKERTKKKKERK